jgi:hypothetical protein
MKTKTLMMALGLAVAPGLAMAADFSGNWVRNAQASEPAFGYPLYWMPRVAPPAAGGGGGGGPGGGTPAPVVVRQTAANLQVVDPNRPVRNYALDGAPHSVPTDQRAGAQVSITAAVRGETLVVAQTGPYSGLPGSVTATTTDTWALSPDGRTLTISSVRSSPARTETSKQVYTKQ